MASITCSGNSVVTSSATFDTLSVNNINTGIVTSTQGNLSSIPSIDTSNLSNTLQIRLNTIETNISNLQSVSDVSVNNVNTTNLTTRNLTISGLSTGFLKSTSGIVSTSTINITDVSGLQLRLSNLDASVNSMSGGSSFDNANYNFVTLDGTVNLMEGFVVSNVNNYATSWTQLNNSPTDNGIGVICSYNGQYILKIGWSSNTYLSNDFGNTWAIVSGTQWSGALSATGQYILMINGGATLSSNYGASWSSLSGVYGSNGCCISPTGRYIIVASSSGIYYSRNYGANFTNWTDTNANSWASVAISADGSTAVAVRNTTPATIWKTTNYGTSWSQIYNNPSSISFGDIRCSCDAKYILVALSQGTSGYMYLSNDFGTTFSQLNSSNGVNSGNYFKITMSANGMYMAVACNTGLVYYSKNFGQNWSATPLGSSYYYGICMSDNASMIYAYIPGQKTLSYNANVTSVITTQPTNPGRGSTYFDEATNKLWVYNANTSAWKSITLT